MPSDHDVLGTPLCADLGRRDAVLQRIATSLVPLLETVEFDDEEVPSLKPYVLDFFRGSGAPGAPPSDVWYSRLCHQDWQADDCVCIGWSEGCSTCRACRDKPAGHLVFWFGEDDGRSYVIHNGAAHAVPLLLSLSREDRADVLDRVVRGAPGSDGGRPAKRRRNDVGLGSLATDTKIIDKAGREHTLVDIDRRLCEVKSYSQVIIDGWKFERFHSDDSYKAAVTGSWNAFMGRGSTLAAAYQNARRNIHDEEVRELRKERR